MQRFMLRNDSVTVAIELPIWLVEIDIAALEHQHGVALAPRPSSIRARCADEQTDRSARNLRSGPHAPRPQA
jgi:hypothetical protein